MYVFVLLKRAQSLQDPEQNIRGYGLQQLSVWLDTLVCQLHMKTAGGDNLLAQDGDQSARHDTQNLTCRRTSNPD